MSTQSLVSAPPAAPPTTPPTNAPPTGAVLHLGDCREIMRGMADGSIDAVVTDPPYGQTNESYDSPVAFDPAVWRECHRITGPNAALVSFAGSPTYHRVASAIEAGGWRVRQMWGWVYRDGMITSAYPREGFDRLAPAMNPIVYATKGKVLLRLNREGMAWESWHPRRNGGTLSTRAGSGACLAADGHWPKSIIATDGVDGFQYFVLSNNAVGQPGEKTGHPNQKPLALMHWLVSKFPPGGVVLDPFAGSGTTGLAALAEGFSFVGCEQSPEYHALADRRLAGRRLAGAGPETEPLTLPTRLCRQRDDDRPLFRLLSPDPSDAEPPPPTEAR